MPLYEYNRVGFHRNCEALDGKGYMRAANGDWIGGSGQITSVRTIPVCENGGKMKEIWRKIHPLLAQQIIDDYQIEEGRCVEIGSGDGKLGLELVKRTALNVYMVDIDKGVLERALSKAYDAGLADRISSIQANVEHLPFVDQFADLVVSRGSIFFWNDKRRGLSEIYRVLKTGGVAFVGGGLSRHISEQEREAFIRARTAELKDEQTRKEWERVRSPEHFRQILRQAGISHFKLIADPPGIWTEIVKEE